MVSTEEIARCTSFQWHIEM